MSWLLNDPLSDINIQLARQIQEYRVTDLAFELILTPLSIEIPEVLGGVTVSATRQGQNIPWHLVVQKAGWFSPENMPLPVILVPGLGTLLFDEDFGPHLPWHSIIDYEKHFALEELPDNFDKDAIQILGRMPINASTTPLVVGNPSWDLPDAESEATKVGDTLNVRPLIGENATIAAVRNALSSASFIHLATHAVFHATSPLESQIKLFDGELSVGDLLGVWSTAKLIVLSACESGSGKPLAGGEISSLATVLLRAGVRSVVASLWPVDDAATAFLMTKFHAALQTNIDVPEALASAMHIVRNEPGWDDPFYWAGFVTFQRGMAH